MPMTTPAMPGTAMEAEESMDLRMYASVPSARVSIDIGKSDCMDTSALPWMRPEFKGWALQRQVLCITELTAGGQNSEGPDCRPPASAAPHDDEYVDERYYCQTHMPDRGIQRQRPLIRLLRTDWNQTRDGGERQHAEEASLKWVMPTINGLYGNTVIGITSVKT